MLRVSRVVQPRLATLTPFRLRYSKNVLNFERNGGGVSLYVNPNMSGGGQKSTTPSNYQHRIFPFNYIIVRFR